MRKLGVSRDEIQPETSFDNDLFFDDKDWTCFLFFIESRFDISLQPEEEQQLNSVGNTIETVSRHLHQAS